MELLKTYRIEAEQIVREAREWARGQHTDYAVFSDSGDSRGVLAKPFKQTAVIAVSELAFEMFHRITEDRYRKDKGRLVLAGDVRYQEHLTVLEGSTWVNGYVEFTIWELDCEAEPQAESRCCDE